MVINQTSSEYGKPYPCGGRLSPGRESSLANMDSPPALALQPICISASCLCSFFTYPHVVFHSQVLLGNMLPFDYCMSINFFLFMFISLVIGQATVTIDQTNVYLIQKDCVRGEMYFLPRRIGCNSWYNECFCREDTSPLAYSYLSSIIPSLCSSNAVDLTSAIYVYTEYCNTAMGRAGEVSAAATTSFGGK